MTAHSRANLPPVELFDPAIHTPPDHATFAPLVEASIKAGPRLILWDLVGSCNLRCPSCPVGTMAGTNPKGMISEELFHRILEKLSREFPNWQLHFYNWTEPLIHPRIADFVRAAADAGFHVHLSSNLNHLRDSETLVAAGAKTFRISLSGFTQLVYERGHRGGNIEKVKKNLIRLSEARKSTGSLTRVHVYFHKYRHNVHELPLMESFARELGFDFIADWAYLMPLEKLIAHVEDDLPDHERNFADDSIVPAIDDAVALMQRSGGRDRPCDLIDQLVLDHQGRVTLCCAVFDGKRNFIAEYLDTDWTQLQQMKYGHRSCDKCMHYAAHTLYTHFSKPDLRPMMEQLSREQFANPPRKLGTRRGPIRLPLLDSGPLAESA